MFVLTLLAAPLVAAGGIEIRVLEEPRQPTPVASAFQHLLAIGEQAEKDRDYETAEASYREALKIARELPRLDPRRVEALEALGYLLDSRLDRSLDAWPFWEEAWELRLASRKATSREAWSLRWYLGQIYSQTHQWERLETFRRLWVELISEAEWADDDDRADALSDLAWSIERQRPDDPELALLLERARELAGDGDDRRGLTRRLAALQTASGRAGEALELLREAAWRAETEPIFDSQEVSSLYQQLGEAAVAAGLPELAAGARPLRAMNGICSGEPRARPGP